MHIQILIISLFAAREYIAPTDTDSRSPCPFLNTLANYGILSRDGKDIPLDMIKYAVMQEANVNDFIPQQVLNFVSQIAHKNEDGELSIHLSDLGNHEVVEHDSSLTREDYDGGRGDNINISTQLVDQLLGFAKDGYLKLEDIIAARKLRVEQSRKLASHVELTTREWSTAHANSVLLAGVMGKDYKISVEHAKIFLLQERFPDGWAKRSRTLGTREFLFRVAQCATS